MGRRQPVRAGLVVTWLVTVPTASPALPNPDHPQTRRRLRRRGPGYYAARIDPERHKRNHIRQLEALGYQAALKPAA